MRAFLRKTALKSELAFLPQKTAFPPPPLPAPKKAICCAPPLDKNAAVCDNIITATG